MTYHEHQIKSYGKEVVVNLAARQRKTPAGTGAGALQIQTGRGPWLHASFEAYGNHKASSKDHEGEESSSFSL